MERVMSQAKSPSAMIFGINGQDGILLARFLLEKNYKLYGFGRKDSILRNPVLCGLHTQIDFAFGDLADPDSITGAIKDYRPSEIYNLAAQSRPGASWDLAVETGRINALGAHHLFEAGRRLAPDCRIYQASSSEMFGDVLESPQNEKTPFNPVNPYAASKVYAHHMARIYRDSFGLFISCGILFNHESRYRDMRYLTQKVAYGAACAKCGIADSPEVNEIGEPIVKAGKLALGNLQAARDWGFAGDYVRAMWLILQQPQPEDFIIGTGILRTARELCETAYQIVGLDWRDHVISDPRFVRTRETGATVADATKAHQLLGWLPTTVFAAMLADMIAAHLDRLDKNRP